MQRKTLVTLFTLALLASTLASPALEAQQDGGRRGDRQGGQDGGRGGRGGRGGGFGGPGGPGGSGLAGLGLIRIEAVRTELKITEDQQELIEILGDELREGRPEFPENYRDLSEDEQAAFREKMQKWGEEQAVQMKETLKTILEEAQYKRLQEISLQTQGVRGLLDPEVAAALNLTADQQAKLKETLEARDEANRTAMREAFQGGGGGGFDRDAMREKMETFRKETETQVLAQITDEQKAGYEALKGAPFAMPEGAFGFGGGPGRGGPGRGGRDSGGRPEGDRPRRPE